MFTIGQVLTLSWQDITAVNSTAGHYRVEVTWALDHYRVRVWRRIQEPEKLVRVHSAFFARTAVKTANRMLRHYGRMESL